MTYVVLRDRWVKEPVIAAIVVLEGQQVRVMASSKLLISLLESVFSYPTRIKERKGDKVYKRAPRNAEENISASMKQNLYYPYRLGSEDEAVEAAKIFKYKKVYPTNILYGESRHERLAETVN